MGAIRNFINPPAPTPPPPPPPPDTSAQDEATRLATQKKLDEAAAAEGKARGRAATLLTGGEGDTSQASISRRTLIGA